MDRMLACEAGDPSSILGESTNNLKTTQRWFLSYDFFIRAESLDFFREALLSFNNPVFTDLSRIFWTSGMKSRASFSFLSETNFFNFFIALFTSSFLFILKNNKLIKKVFVFFS